MKKTFFTLFSLLFILSSCSSEGTQGPQGPQGPPGADGLLGTVFEIEGDFTAGNDYTLFRTYSDYTDVEVFESDVVLVYLRVGQDGEAEGEPVYVWRLLPQTYYVDGGTMQYNYDYTYFDVNIFLDGDVSLSSLDPVFTQDQVFRVAILPAEMAQAGEVDVSNMESVMTALKKSGASFPELELQ